MLRSLGINLSLFGCAVLGIWVCLEIGFAVGAPQIPIREPLMYAPHSVLRYVPNPGTSWRYRTTEFDTQVAFNAHGFRNIERPLEKPAGTFRILCLGDSFTLGAEVAMRDSYAYILEQLLNKRAASLGDSIRFEVMNGGVGGSVGVGEALIEAIISWCTERNCVGIDSMALPGNRATKNFFETFGFKARLLTVHKPLTEP